MIEGRGLDWRVIAYCMQSEEPRNALMAKFRPFYAIGPSYYYYRMYFDLDALPVDLWQYQGEG